MQNATVEFRQVHERRDGQTVQQWTEYRVREVVISLGIISLSAWGPWRKWSDVVNVDQDGNPI